MSQAHGVHDGVAVALYDGCSRCAYLSTDLTGLDGPNLRKLASLAEGMVGQHIASYDYSSNDAIAVQKLRLMARVVFESDITKEVAR